MAALAHIEFINTAHNGLLSLRSVLERNACGMGHGIPLLLFPITRDSPAHRYIEFFRLQSIFLLHQNLLRFWLCFSSHVSSKALFNLCPSSALPSWPYSSQTSIAQARHLLLKEKEGWGDDPGMRYISVPVSCHVSRQNMATELLPAPWVPSESKRWCQDISLFIPPTIGVFFTFDPMTFTTIIHCSSESFCSAQILFCSPFLFILFGRRWCLSERR